MSQSNKEDKSDSENESSSDSKSGSSSDSESESGSSSSSSSSDNENENANDTVNDGVVTTNNNESKLENGNVSDHNETKSDNDNVDPQNHDNDEPNETNDKTKSSNNTSGSEDSDNSDDSNDDDSDESAKQNNQEEEEEEDDSSNHSEENYHSSKSSYDDEDYAANKRKSKKKEVKRKPAAKGKGKNNSRWKSETSESESGDDSESDDDYKKPVAKKKVAPKPRQKKRNSYSSDGSGSDDEKKRAATRRTTSKAAVSYKEASENEKTDSDDLLDIEVDEEAAAAAAAAEETDKSETIERIVGKRIGKKGATGGPTTVYEVEENGDPNDGVDENDEENTESQYLIKWKGWSFIHCTYESENTLKEQKVKGLKKLENYMKRESDIDAWKRRAGPEDIDYFECQQELHQELLKSYYNVERIICQTEKPEGGIDYLCKWESLPYSDSTWEDASLVHKKWSSKIEEFNDRENSKRTPSKHCKVIKYRPKFHHVKSQPEYMGLERGLALRDYQMDGLNWLILTWCKENSVILADEMGLGKTIQTICFLYYLYTTQNLYGPFLCVVPLSTMTAWQREFQIWAPEMNVVTYLGDVQSREMIRLYEWSFASSKRLKFNVILTTYEILLKDKTFLGCLSWAALLVDEAHRLKNDDSLLYKALKDFDTNYRLLITGTPLQNSLKELWALLHFIMPVRFATWEDFEVNYATNSVDKGYSKLHKELEPYILRRVKKDVEKSLPAKVEQILRVEMTSTQRQYYKWILTKNFGALRKGVKGSMTTFLNIVIELKKCCNHALLTKPIEFEQQQSQEDVMQTLLKGSGKLVLLDKLLCRLKETGHRVLIFSQMVRMLDILAEYLQKRHFSFQRLDGSIKGELRKQALDHFNAEGSSDFCFLLSTRAGGLGINLATADTVIIFDSDWNPQNDLQAQARAHRIGQKNQVNIYRLVTARSVEEEIVERAKKKMVLDHLVIQRMDTTGRTVLDKNGGHSGTQPFNKDELSAILKFGAEELFKEEEEGDEELVCDIDEILRRAETRDEAPEMPGDELLSAFKVASFAFDEEKDTKSPKVAEPEINDNDTKDWDDIIPENLRKAVEAEERSKEIEDLYLPPRRKTLQQLNQTNEGEGTAGRKRKSKESEDEYEDDGSDASGEDRPKKRGRPSMKEKIMGFSDAELRRFIKSYKKFPAPSKRLEAIACDAELQEKPLNDLKKVAEMLHERCVQFLEEHSKENETEAKETGKKRAGRAMFSMKFGNVTLNAKTMLACVDELQPLDDVIPSNPDDRAKWVLDLKTRPSNFDVDWNVEDDSRLLCGIYQFGIGSWEAMKMEPSLHLSEKILSNADKKPQAKHLQSRAEYLLRLIAKSLNSKKGNSKVKKQRKPKEPKSGSNKDVPEAEDISSTDEKKTTKAKKAETDNHHHHHHHSHDDASNGPVAEKKKAKHKEPKKPKKKNAGPMHFTANNEPCALKILGDMDPTIFNECKEKMRPVKKALKALDNPDQSLSPQEQVNHTRACLLNIGNQINHCLMEYKDPEKIKEWRSNLWYFVSKFTESDAKKLFKLYKHALKRTEDHGQNSNNNSPVKDAKETNAKTTPKSGAVNKIGKIGKINKKDMNEKEKAERRERKEKKRHQIHNAVDGNLNKDQRSNEKEREKYLGQDVLGSASNDSHKDDSSHSKRRLEDGECDVDSKEYKRLHGDNRNNRDRDKKWDEYNDRDRERMRNNPRGPGPTTPQNMRMYSDPRDGRTPYADNWSGRDRFSDHKRDRYDNYNRHPQSQFHRERDHRDRDRDRERPYKDKRSRFQPIQPGGAGGGYQNSHYNNNMAQGMYYQPGDVPYRDRYSAPGSSVDWRDREYGAGNAAGGEYDYRRGNEYDRRPPPSANT